MSLPAISEYALAVFSYENDPSPQWATQFLRKEIEPFPRFNAFCSYEIFSEEVEKPSVAEPDKTIAEAFLKRKKKRFRQTDVAETAEMNEENLVFIQLF